MTVINSAPLAPDFRVLARDKMAAPRVLLEGKGGEWLSRPLGTSELCGGLEACFHPTLNFNKL